MSLARLLRSCPETTILSQDGPWTSRDLWQHADELSSRLRGGCVGLLADNHPRWLALDLAALHRGITLLPLPDFFSDSQLQHALRTAGCESVWSDSPTRLRRILPGADLESGPLGFCIASTQASSQVPRGIAKLSFTSGSTGRPRGVLLREGDLQNTLLAIQDVVKLEVHDRSDSLLPLSMLLENLAGGYLPLLAGSTLNLFPLGRSAHTHHRPDAGPGLLEPLARHHSTISVFTPGMLEQLIGTMEQTKARLPKLRFLAVGGAPLSGQLAARAAKLGLPVFQGYGLTEAASVVSMESSGVTRTGSVGRPLSHVHLHIDSRGEIHTRSSAFAGYLGEPAPSTTWHATGDLGSIDADGFLFIHGRRQRRIATAYGRNVQPEWVEAELEGHSAIEAAVVLGDGHRQLAALLFARGTESEVSTAVERTNRQLPRYAHIHRWAVIPEAASEARGTLTTNGKLRHPAVAARYASLLPSFDTSHTLGAPNELL